MTDIINNHGGVFVLLLFLSFFLILGIFCLILSAREAMKLFDEAKREEDEDEKQTGEGL
jgi:uncharacterized protein YpmS